MTGARSTRTANWSVNPPGVRPANLCLSCSRVERDTKETVSNALRIIRIRFGIPHSELPDLDVEHLGSFLQFLLLQGKERATVIFPRRQVQPDGEGLTNLNRLGRRERWAFGHSVNSIKRNLPSGCRLHVPSARLQWEANAFSTPPPPSPEYLTFVRRKVLEIFPSCWDKDYASIARRHVPNSTARSCKGRADQLWAGQQEEFLDLVLNGSGLPESFEARYKEVLSAGKVRPLLIFDKNVDLLAPLHKCLHRHLSKQRWLLAGPPTAEKMESVCAGRYQTSVDLVNATDGLSLQTTKVILDSLLHNSVIVPRGIRELAHASLHPRVNGKIVQHGQMMGAYLSFPLLCLHSFLAASWASRDCKGATVLVNGDDCVISADRIIKADDYPEGYRLNDKKTIRSENVVEINSTAFLKQGSKWREVHHLRRGGSTTSYSGMLHMAAACQSSPAWTDAFVRSRIGKSWGFLPSQLDLHPASRAYYRRETSMCKKRIPTSLPLLVSANDDRLLRRAGLPDPDEVDALCAHLFRFGRPGGAKRDTYDISIGAVRRTYAYRRSSIRSSVSFGAHIASLRVARAKLRTDTYFVPDDYVSQRELGRLILLEKFASQLACPT